MNSFGYERKLNLVKGVHQVNHLRKPGLDKVIQKILDWSEHYLTDYLISSCWNLLPPHQGKWNNKNEFNVGIFTDTSGIDNFQYTGQMHLGGRFSLESDLYFFFQLVTKTKEIRDDLFNKNLIYTNSFI